MRKSPVVTNTKKKRNEKRVKKGQALLLFINKLMPYLLAIGFVITLFSIANIAGTLGIGWSGFLYGCFSNFGTYFVTIFVLYHSLMWYHDLNSGICRRRVICSFITVLCVSAMQQIITSMKGADINAYNFGILYMNGEKGIGGGSLGGLLGVSLIDLLGHLGAVLAVLFILFFMILQMFNITPASVANKLMSEKRRKKKEAIAKEKQRKRITASLKHRKFNVFDDEDDNSFTTSTIEKLDIPTIEVDKRDYAPHAPVSVNEEVRRPSSLYESRNQPPASEFELTSRYQSPVEQPKPLGGEIKSDFHFERRSDNSHSTVKPAFTFPDPVSKSDDFTTSDFNVDDIAATREQPRYEAPKTSFESRYEAPKPTFTPVYDAPKTSCETRYETANPTFTPVFDAPKSTYESSYRDSKAPYESISASWDDEPINDLGTYNGGFDETVMDDDLDAAIFKEENKDNTLSDYLSDKAFEQINGYSKEEREFNISRRPAEHERPVERPTERYMDPPVAPTPVVKPKRRYVFPPIDIFEKRVQNEEMAAAEREELEQNASIIVETLCSFNAKTKIVDVQRGPTVTRYELVPEAGVRVRSIANLVDDIALNLAADGIRIECPIPGKSAVGIEVPNKITSMVYLRGLLEDPQFKNAKSPATCAVGKSISGENVYIDIAKMPHLLVAGATGMGKSVCINSLLVSLLYKASPDDLRLILIDPKRVEFSVYNGLPHLLVPVVCEAKKSIGTLQWAVAEMENRFQLLEMAGVRDIGEYNDRVERGVITASKIARIVIVIDELYDLKMQVPEIDEYIIRLTQKARAAGIHVIIGTQRPSVDVITGVIKANIPSRIAFRVPAQVDSRTILDEVGAEKLVSRGDMLLKPVGALKPIRVQGAYISEDEREAVTRFIKENSSENYDEDVVCQIESNTSKLAKADKARDNDEPEEDMGDEFDEKFYVALGIATDMGKISSSYLQRKLNLGFQRAARIIDQMESAGYIGPANGSKPREVLITKQEFMELRMKNDD